MRYASLCFLSYQRPHFIAQAVMSAVASTKHPLELIIHDDGSTDEAVLEYLTGLQRSGAVSSLILNPPGHNQGQGVALNRMFSLATGDPIIKLDQDLTFSERWLERVCATLDGDDHIGLLGLLKYDYEPVDWRKTGYDPDQLRAWGVEAPVGHSYHTHILGSGFAVPRRVWEDLRPFENHSEAFAEDWAFQQAVTAHNPDLFCALRDEDLVVNHGMGIGPSTVVVAEGTVAKINKRPALLNDEFAQVFE